ncbi:hypothetical protein N8977_05340, partial [Alphaproteobacteria bacterium]|nr:hypothetical protein [Alphaproteobacteria bacterium]
FIATKVFYEFPLAVARKLRFIANKLFYEGSTAFVQSLKNWVVRGFVFFLRPLTRASQAYQLNKLADRLTGLLLGSYSDCGMGEGYVYVKTTDGLIYSNLFMNILDKVKDCLVLDTVSMQVKVYKDGRLFESAFSPIIGDFESLVKLLGKIPAKVFVDVNFSDFNIFLIVKNSPLTVHFICPCLISGTVTNYGWINSNAVYLGYGKQSERAIKKLANSLKVVPPKYTSIGCFFAKSSNRIVAERAVNYQRRTLLVCLGGDFISEETKLIEMINAQCRSNLKDFNIVVRFHPNVNLNRKYPRRVFKFKNLSYDNHPSLNDAIQDYRPAAMIVGPSSSFVHALVNNVPIAFFSAVEDKRVFTKIEFSGELLANVYTLGSVGMMFDWLKNINGKDTSSARLSFEFNYVDDKNKEYEKLYG